MDKFDEKARELLSTVEGSPLYWANLREAVAQFGRDVARESAAEMLDMIRGSLCGYPHLGGDIEVMREVERIVREVREECEDTKLLDWLEAQRDNGLPEVAVGGSWKWLSDEHPAVGQWKVYRGGKSVAYSSLRDAIRAAKEVMPTDFQDESGCKLGQSGSSVTLPGVEPGSGHPVVMITCWKCGSVTRNDSDHCTHCGVLIGAYEE